MRVRRAGGAGGALRKYPDGYMGPTRDMTFRLFFAAVMTSIMNIYFIISFSFFPFFFSLSM